MIREAVATDIPALSKFLRQHSDPSMFLRSNLQDFGLGNTVDPFAMRYFLYETAGQIAGVGAICNNTMVMVQAPFGLPEIASHIGKILGPIPKPMGMLGDAGQVEQLRALLGLSNTSGTLDDVEPLFKLDLEDLIIPDITKQVLAAPQPDDMDILHQWSHEYSIEALKRSNTEKTKTEAYQDADNRTKLDKLRILFDDGKPVAQTAFNAVLPDMVQVGGVYTPPTLRGRGYARRAVALHLAEARANGVKKAILFSANDYASAAYRAVGFQQIGEFTLVIFDHTTGKN